MVYSFSPFRNHYQKPEPGAACHFCSESVLAKQTIKSNGLPVENDYYRWVVNWYPKFEGHTMLIPKRHFCHLSEETEEEEEEEEVLARHRLLKVAIARLEHCYPKCGLEYFIQTGSGSGSTVPHLHWHLVPASPADQLRSFEKLGHFYTTKEGEEKVVVFPQRITMGPEELLSFLST